MAQELNKETAKKLMEIKGEARGISIRTDMEFVLKEKGEDGLRAVEKELEEVGFPIKYREIENLNYYKAGLRALSLLAIKKTFGFEDEKIREIGFFGTRISLILKFFTRYIFSFKLAFVKEAPKIWRKHWTVGQLIPVEFNEEKKYGVLRIKNLKLHPLYCRYLEGYFSGLVQLITKNQQVACQETKCPFRGDEYHEYLIKWK